MSEYGCGWHESGCVHGHANFDENARANGRAIGRANARGSDHVNDHVNDHDRTHRVPWRVLQRERHLRPRAKILGQYIQPRLEASLALATYCEARTLHQRAVKA